MLNTTAFTIDNKIVADISSAISTENHIYIDTVESNIRQISIIHISALVDEMTNFIEQEENEDLKIQELEKKLGERIMEVLLNKFGVQKWKEKLKMKIQVIL